MRVQFYRDDSGEHRWKVTSANNERVGASSEGFDSIAACRYNFTLLTGRSSATGALGAATRLVATGLTSDEWEVVVE